MLFRKDNSVKIVLLHPFLPISKQDNILIVINYNRFRDLILYGCFTIEVITLLGINSQNQIRPQCSNHTPEKISRTKSSHLPQFYEVESTKTVSVKTPKAFHFRIFESVKQTQLSYFLGDLKEIEKFEQEQEGKTATHWFLLLKTHTLAVFVPKPTQLSNILDNLKEIEMFMQTFEGDLN